MYIRKTQSLKRKAGGDYYTYRLVESRCTKKEVRQRTLLNLGVDFSLPREQWPDLTKRIEDILCGQQSLFDIDADIERLAQGYASRIIISHQEVSSPDDIDYREVDLDGIELSRPRSVGGEHVTLEALRFSGLDKKQQSWGKLEIRTESHSKSSELPVLARIFHKSRRLQMREAPE